MFLELGLEDVRLMIAFSSLKSSFCSLRLDLKNALDKLWSCLGESHCPS